MDARDRRSVPERPDRATPSTGGFVGPEIDALHAYLGIPGEFTPIGVMPVGRPLPDVRSPSLKRGWVPPDEFARWEAWHQG